MLVLFWTVYVAVGSIEMSMFARFMSRLAAHGLLLLGILVWWLSRRGVSWGDRLLALAVFVVGSAAMLSVGRSVDHDRHDLADRVCLGCSRLGVAWLVVSRNSSALRARRVGLVGGDPGCARSASRWSAVDGLDGYAARRVQLAVESDGRSNCSWRATVAWSPMRSHRRGGTVDRCSRATCPAFAARSATAW